MRIFLFLGAVFETHVEGESGLEVATKVVILGAAAATITVFFFMMLSFSERMVAIISETATPCCCNDDDDEEEGVAWMPSTSSWGVVRMAVV